MLNPFSRRDPGERAFQQCDAKDVSFGSYSYYDLNGKTYFNTRAQVLALDNHDPDTRRHAGYYAELECPRSPSSGRLSSAFESKMDKPMALQSLQVLAGQLVCRNCPYSGLTRTEALLRQADEKRAEAELLSATAAYTEALQELRRLDPTYSAPALPQPETKPEPGPETPQPPTPPPTPEIPEA